jgi:hypothetical protein
MFGSSSKSTPPANALRIQSSIAGIPIQIGWGRNRISGNLIWTGDFASQGGSGGGGGKGGGGKGGGSTTYTTSVIIGLCEGPVWQYGPIWNNSTQESLANMSLAGMGGDYGAEPWSYMTSVHPDEALAYRGLATAVGASIPLGSSPNLPNLTFLVTFAIAYAIPGIPDADPAAVVIDYLTNPYYGVGFPPEFVGALTSYSDYCVANGLVVSPVLTTQAEARGLLNDLMIATNSECVWSNGQLTVVPYGDVNIAANGRTWIAPSAPLYSLSDIDFKKPQGTNNNSSSSFSSDDPVQCTRLRPSDQNNQIWIEFLDSTNAYNPNTVSATDDASANIYGLRKADTKTLHFFTNGWVALLSAQLMLGREAVDNTYAVTVGPEYILLEPMDIIAITDVPQGLVVAWVYTKEIQENNDYTLTLQLEDALFGAGNAPIYAAQPALGSGLNLNAAPSGVTTPVIWEPTYALAGGTEIWLAVAGTANFGGADIYVSTDGDTYALAGTFEGASRIGLTTAALASVAVASTGPTIDQVNTIGVDMSESGAQLASGTQQDALLGNTVCYLGGEYLAYQTATLVSGSAYTLSYLVRGLYDSSPQASGSGTPLVRLSAGSYFRYPLTVDRIGQTLYFKAVPFNDFGGGGVTIDEVSATAYTITGVALAEALAAPSNLTTSYVAQYTYLTWDQVTDWRGPDYEIRKGASWASGQVLGTVAAAPWLVYGDDTYWVASVVTPSPGLVVYSTPVSISIQGSAIVSNIMNAWNELATGWTGTLTGGCVVSGGIVVSSDSGSGEVGGTYEIPTAHEINVGRACACNVLINWTSAGYPEGQNLLGVVNFLTQTDLLGAASAGNVDVYPQISIDPGTGTYGLWQNFAPGSYVGQRFRARMQIRTTDAKTVAALTSFTFFVAAPERDDHYLGLSVASGGTALVFKPDNTSTAVAFNGGPNASTVPSIQGTIIGGAAGDTLLISGETVSGCTVQVVNGGAGVARNVNLLVQGY